MSAAQDLIRAMNTVVAERARQEKTQADIADLIGMSQPSVARLENVHLTPEPVVNFFRMAAALGLSVKVERSSEVAA